MLSKIKILLACCIFLVCGCAKEELKTTEPCELCDLYIYGTYTNYTGENPTFVINTQKTSKYITYGIPTTKDTAVTVGRRVRLIVPDIKIKKDNKNYNFDNFVIEEFISDTWKKQYEFQKDNKSLENSLAVVMVLDMSTSLGSDVQNVKSSAISFANKFLTPTNSKGELGLVLFNENINSYPFTNNLNTISNTISSYYNYRDATTLYGAMDRGIEMLNNYNKAVDEKVLVTFTDGRDNNTDSPSTVRSRIVTSKYPRYVIGLEGKGDYDEVALRGLASQDNYFVSAYDKVSLSYAFDEIFDMISTTNSIQYDRTPQKFQRGSDAPIEIRIKLTVKK